MVGENDIALGVHDADMAAGGDLVGVLVIVHPVGNKSAVLVGDLHMSHRRDQVIFAIINNLVGLKQNGLILGRRFDGGDPVLRRKCR